MNADWKLEKAQYAEFSAQTCDKIAVWPLCRERQPLRNSHDGPNYIRVLLTWFMQVGLGKPSHENRQRWTLDISVFLRLRQIPSRPAKGFLFWKNFIEQLKLILKWMLIERWRRPSKLSSMCQHVARLQFDSCAKKQSVCGTVMMAWICHVWINAIVFVPAAKAPPEAAAKELSYNSLI